MGAVEVEAVNPSRYYQETALFWSKLKRRRRWRCVGMRLRSKSALLLTAVIYRICRFLLAFFCLYDCLLLLLLRKLKPPQIGQPADVCRWMTANGFDCFPKTNPQTSQSRKPAVQACASRPKAYSHLLACLPACSLSCPVAWPAGCKVACFSAPSSQQQICNVVRGKVLLGDKPSQL
ncbi:hypothetical protein ABW21_db0203626 [Orbilia brochopaga]|nr:hypothetical protein ABW21_db0203626 [Drechslerella brochopaga]